jgi:hypothetical protein
MTMHSFHFPCIDFFSIAASFMVNLDHILFNIELFTWMMRCLLLVSMPKVRNLFLGFLQALSRQLFKILVTQKRLTRWVLKENGAPRESDSHDRSRPVSTIWHYKSQSLDSLP